MRKLYKITIRRQEGRATLLASAVPVTSERQMEAL